MLTNCVGCYSSPAVVIEGLCFTEPMPCLVSPGSEAAVDNDRARPCYERGLAVSKRGWP
jgi:hypothetical protein